MQDLDFMHQALELAQRGRGWTSPNPMVGAVIVKDGRVYTMPNTPFSWCDRPPSVNRFLGIQWVANMLYPKAYDVDMVEVTKEFYSLLYHGSGNVAEAIITGKNAGFDAAALESWDA